MNLFIDESGIHKTIDNSIITVVYIDLEKQEKLDVKIILIDNPSEMKEKMYKKLSKKITLRLEGQFTS